MHENIQSPSPTVINLETSEIQNNKLQFKLPYCEFPIHFGLNSTICVSSICIIWKTSAGAFYGSLHSSLIEASPINPSQELLLFANHKESNFTYFTPTHPAHYKIDRSNLRDSVFEISLFALDETEKNITTENIEKVKIQLIVNDRFQ